MASILSLMLGGCGEHGPSAIISLQAGQGQVSKSVSQPFWPLEIPTVYRFAKISNGAYFYTGSEAEVREIFANYPDFRYEGPAFEKDATGLGQPVYRFANLQNGGYFFTGSADERDQVLRNYPHMRFEGSSFSVAPPAETDAQPIYRLANTNNGAYLYTLSAAERDYAQSLGMWRSEGSTFRNAFASTLKNKVWQTGQPLEQNDLPVDDFDVQIDDSGRATAIYFKQSNGRRTLFSTRGLPSGGNNLAWTTPIAIDLDALGARLSIDDQNAQGSIKPVLAMAANGNAFAVWSTQADCGANNYLPPGQLCSFLVGATFIASTGSWSPAKIIASTNFGGDINAKINSRGDLAIMYVGWQIALSGAVENVPALVWRSASSSSSTFQKALFVDAKFNLSSAARAVGLDEVGGLYVAHPSANSFGGSKIIALRGTVDTGLAAPEQISAAGQFLQLVTGRNGRTLVTYIENNGTDVLKAALTEPNGTGAWSSSSLVTSGAGFNTVRYNYAENNAGFATVDDQGVVRIQSLRCYYLEYRSNVWRPEQVSVPNCTPQGLSGDPLLIARNGNYISIENSSFGALRWVSYDAKRNRAVHAVDLNTALTAEDLFFRRVPTSQTQMALDWTRTKSALSINGSAVIVTRGALDELPSASATSGVSRPCGNGVPCISNLWAFALQ
jgi:Repeat of unknown function (DUF5648)